MTIADRPWVWLPADHRAMEPDATQLPYLMLGHKYAFAAKEAAGAQPVVFPLSGSHEIEHLLAQVDGVMLTGSPANVHPRHFDEEVADLSLPLDTTRDELTLALVRACALNAVPLLGICRGFQEINVAMGGSLHQQVHAVSGKHDHREDKHAPFATQYGPAHALRIVADSPFAQWAGGVPGREVSVQVNSLHGQGVAKLAPGLRAQAYAPDGLIEAFSIESSPVFAHAVQWHPEWRFWENPFYSAIFKAFGQACQARRNARLHRSI